MYFMIHAAVMVILAVVTHTVVSVLGSYLHEVGTMNLPYAVFTFSDDRHESMTTNILMNVFIPNICIIFLFLGVVSLGWTDRLPLLAVYCVSYYVYRFFLICVILGRKELYNVKYELSIAAAGIFCALLLMKFFLQSEDTLFISVSELREELWFAVILIVYGVIKNILDRKVKQDDVLTEKQLRNYIENKFDSFYKKYGSALGIDYKNTYLCIVLFAIMIFEDFNRRPIFRKLEEIKVKTGHETTVGIMQVKSDRVLSDRESVRRAYDLILQYGKDYTGRELTEGEVWEIATQYNRGEGYGASVAYIYMRIQGYIRGNGKYRRDFCLEMPDGTAEKKRFVCASVSEMCKNLQDDCEIDLAAMTADILDGVEETGKIRVNRENGGWELVLSGLNGVVINGNASRLYARFHDVNVLTLENCHNVKIRDLKLGYETENGNCGGNIMKMEMCSGIILENVALCGAGAFGIYAHGSDCVCSKVKICCCEAGAIRAEYSTVRLSDTEIFDCKKCDSDLIYVFGELALENVELHHNRTELALINTNRRPFEFHGVRIHDNGYRKKSFFTEDLSELEWENNTHLGWG